MGDFLIKMGIQISPERQLYEKALNIAIFVFNLLYTVISAHNIVGAESINIKIIFLNLLSFVVVILTNYRKEKQKSDPTLAQTEQRYSLYFFLFLFEALLAVLLILTMLVFRQTVEQAKFLIFMIILITFVDKTLDIVINCYRGK